jgi:hypothetical protein
VASEDDRVELLFLSVLRLNDNFLAKLSRDRLDSTIETEVFFANKLLELLDVLDAAALDWGLNSGSAKSVIAKQMQITEDTNLSSTASDC